MMRALITFLVFVFVWSSAFAEKYVLDTSHTAVTFTVSHLVIAKVKGRFDKFEGAFNFDEKSGNLDNILVNIEADSVNTNEKDRDKDLRSSNFLDVTKYPKLTFKSTKTIYEDKKPKKLMGDLTIHGVTKPVTLELEYNGAITDPRGDRRVAFSAETKIDRKDFGLKWNKILETGGVMVGNEVKIEIEGEAIMVPPKK